MTDMPLVSIISPAYNAARFIGYTIESVQRQTYSNWEMLVSNDCSTDTTAEIVNRYANSDNRIRLINCSENGGVSQARNRALSNAKGRYIAFLDSDDCWMPDKLEKQIRFMQSKDIAFSFTSYQLMNENGEKLERYVLSKQVMTYNDVIKNTHIGCLTVVIDKSKVGSFRMPLIPHTEDTMTWAEILMRGYTAYGIPDVLALYRISSSSITSRKTKMAKLQWKTYRDYCKYGFVRSLYYFCCYAVNAVFKFKHNRGNSRSV